MRGCIEMPRRCSALNSGLLNVEMLDTEMGLLITFAVNPIPQLWK